MGFDVREYAKKRKHENTSNGATGGFNVRGLAALDSFTKEYGAWEKSANDFITNHNKRYFNGDGTYNDVYRADTSEWYQQAASQQAEIDNKRKELLGYLENVRGVVSDDVWKEYSAALTSDFADLVEFARNDYDFMSRFADEQEYAKHKKYSGMPVEQQLARYNELQGIINGDTVVPTGSVYDQLQALGNGQSLFTPEQQKAAANDELNELLTYGAGRTKAYARQQKYAENAKRIAELEAQLKNPSSGDSWSTTTRELNRLKNENNAYERNTMAADGWYDVFDAADFDELSVAAPMNYREVDMWNAANPDNPLPYGTDMTWEEAVATYGGTDDWRTDGAHYMPVMEQVPVYENATEDEKRIATYLKNKDTQDGTRRFLEYVQSMQDVWKERQQQSNYQAHVDYLTNAKPWEMVGIAAAESVASIGTNVAGAPVAAADLAMQLISTGEIDRFTPEQQVYNYGQSVRGAIAEAINNRTNGASFAGITAGDLYQVTMSAADSAVGLALTPIFGVNGYTAIMGMGAATTETKRLYENGATIEQAVSGGILAGAAEMITEKIGLERAMSILQSVGKKKFTQIVFNILSQQMAEAGEEVLAELSNVVTNAFVMGEMSDINVKIEKLLAEGKYTRAEAESMALADVGADIWKAGVGGWISGGFIGAGASLVNHVESTNDWYRQQGETIVEQGGADPLMALANDMHGVTKLEAARLQKQSQAVAKQTQKDAASSKSYRAIGRLSDTVDTIRGRQNRTDIADSLRKNGMAKTEAKRTAALIARAMEDETLSKAELAKLNSKEVETALTEIGGKVKQRNTIHTLARAGIKTSAQDTTAPVNKPVEERAFKAEQAEASEDTTETAGISQIASISDGVMTLELTDGSKVDAAEYVFASEDEALVYESVLHMGANAATANALVQQFQNGKVSADTYVRGIAEAYMYGQYGLAESEMSPVTFTADLSAEQRHTAYRLGQTDAKAAVAAEQAKIDNLKRAVVQAKSTGEVYSEDGTVLEESDKHTETQKASIRALKSLATALKLDFYVYESYEDENGNRVWKTPDGTVEKAPNGFFVGSDSKIHIDLNAGLKGEGTMLYTVSHELGHFIKKWSPKKFKALADFLAKTYGKHGHSVVDLVREQQAKAKRNGREISFDEAYEEFVCDSLARMLTDGDAAAKIQALQKYDASIVAKIKEFFADLANKLKAVRNAYKDIDPGSVEGRFINESLAEFDRLQQLFAEALVDAADAYNSTEQTKNTTEDGDVKYDSRSFSEQVDRVLNGEDTSSTHLRLTEETPSLLQEAGLPKLPILMTAQHLKSIIAVHGKKNSNYHGLSVEIVKNLPRYIANPVMLADSLSRDDSVVVITEAVDSNNRPVIAAILLDGKGRLSGKHIDANIMTSAYGKDKFQSFLNRLADNDAVFYWHQKKSQDLSVSLGLQLPNAITSLDPNFIIRKAKASVKEKLSDRDTAGRRLSAEQQEFFKDSKVRDENGNLIALYHGTENGGFTVFDAAKSDDGISLFFTDDLKVAETYSGSDDDVALPAAKPPMLRWTEGNTKRGKQQAGVYEVYLNLKNPLVVECEGKTWGSIPFGDGTPVDLSYHIKHGEIVFSVKAKDRPTQTVRFADNANTAAEVRKFLTKTFNKEIGKRYSELFASVREDDADYGWKDSFERAVAFPFNWDFSNNTLVPTSTRGIAAQAKKEGYDGVIFRNLHDYGGHKVKGVSYASKKTTNIYVAFNKNAVKDVDNKTPTANKDIRYDDRDAIDKSSRQGDNNNKQYTEEQYNAFGWASYNGVLSAKERETLLSRFADFKHNRHNYPVTRWGEAVIHSTETPDVIVYVRVASKIRTPEITRIVRIVADTSQDISEIRERIIKNEEKQIVSPYSYVTALYGEEYLRFHRKRDYASFRQYQDSREEGRGSKAVVSDPGKQQDGGRSVRESESALREDGGVKLSDRDPAEIDRLRRVNQTLQTENEHLQEDVARLREVLVAQGEPVNGRRFSKTAVEAAATQLMQRAGARFRGDKAELVSMLNTVYDDLASDGDLRWETIAEKARPIVEWVQAHRPVDSVEQDYYRELTARKLLADVYDSFWNATTLHTLTTEIDQLKGKHKQQMKALRERRDAKIKALKTEYRERIKRIRKQKNAAIDREVLRTRETYRNTLEKRKEATAAREARAKLQKLVLDTAKWLAYPSKTDVKCPDILREPYAEFLSSIDLTSKRQRKGGEATHNDLRIKSAMDSLANAVDKVRIAQDPSTDVDNILDSGYLDLPAHFVAELRDMADSIKADMTGEHYVINEMKAEDIRKVSKLIRTLNHAIKEMGKIYATGRFANVQALGADSMTFMDELGELEKTSVVGDYVAWDNALPYYAFKRFGQGGEALFEALMDGQDKLAFLAKTIFDFRDANWTEKEAKAWSEDTHTIELPSGGKLTLTTSDAMSIYCLSRREQAVGHLLGGGVCVKGLKKGSVQAKDSSSQLTVEDIAVVTASLSDRQIEVANAIQGFMSTVCAEWGNEISMKRFLTREFTEKFYFPIESNDANLDTKDPSAQQSDLYRLLNISATKPTVKGANNEVIVRNIFDVFTQHASDMAKLNAFGLPVLDCMKWLNYRERSVNEDGQITTRGVRKSMESAYGKAAKGYVINLVKDVNGRASDGGDPTILMKWLRMAKTANVGFNARVVTLQFTAYPRAAMVLSPASLAKGLTKAPQIQKAREHCGIALWKSFGFYDTNIARSIEDQIKGTTNIRQKIVEISLKGAEYADAVTWGALWNACEYEVAATGKFKVGSEEFNEAVAKKLREVIYTTQVVDSQLTRSQNMRQKTGMAQEAYAFMSEPTVSANILENAYFQFNLEKRRTGSAKLAWKKTGKDIGRAIAVSVSTGLMVALVGALNDAWRDDDDEEYGKKFMEAFGKNVILEILPFNKIPIIADVSEAALSLLGVGYFSTESMASQWLSQAVMAINAWKSVLKGNSSTSVYGALYKTVRVFSSFSGIALSGAMREAVALWNNTAGAIDSELKIRTSELSDAKRLNNALENGDAARARELAAEIVDEKMAKGKTATEAKASVRSSMTSYWKPLFLEAYQAKDNAEMARIRRLLKECGVYEDVIETTQNWIKSLAKK